VGTRSVDAEVQSSAPAGSGPDGHKALCASTASVSLPAGELAQGRVKGTGALGPVDAFGLDRIEAACTEVGFWRC